MTTRSFAVPKPVLDPSVGGIFYKESVSEDQAAFYQAHEFGHHFLDSATGACSGTDIEVTMPEERIPLGIQRVEGYGPRERRECQANVFAREFLLPCGEARRLFSEEKLPASRYRRASREFRSGWCTSNWRRRFSCRKSKTPEMRRPSCRRWTIPRRLPLARRAGPHLIEAGPGTGKTRTLIARIEWLLEAGSGSGIDPRPNVLQQGG